MNNFKMGNFTDHPNKRIIRELWCKRIIQFICDQLKEKLTYFGLPGLKAIDLNCWIDYIDYIVAVDCGHYVKKIEDYDEEVARINITELQDVLNDYERKEIITGFSLYLGFLEIVVLKGFDINNERFALQNCIHIYNLDFCNSLTMPLRIPDLEGGINEYYKNDVIRKLLEFERDIQKPKNKKKFIMFITVHSAFFEQEVDRYFTQKDDTDYIKYSHTLDLLPNIEIKVRKLRYYFIDILLQQFISTGFIPYFCPTIRYKGTGQNTLLCFTVIGIFTNNPSSIAPCYLKVSDLGNEKFLYPSKNGFEPLNDNSNEKDVLTDPITHLLSLPNFRDIF